MSKLYILGAGYTGLKLAMNLREKDKNFPLVLIDKEERIVFRKNIWDCFITSKKIPSIDLVSFCKEHNIEFINTQIKHIEPSKKRFITKSGERIRFDRAVISLGLRSKCLSVRGEYKKGVFYLSSITPLNLRNYLLTSRHIILYISSVLGIEILLYLLSGQREIKVIIPNSDFFSRIEYLLNKILAGRRDVDIYLGKKIEEFIGEASIRATRVDIPKVFASELVFIDSGLVSNIDMLEEPIIRQDGFFTQFEDIFLLGDITLGDTDEEIYFNFDSDDLDKQVDALSYFFLTGKRMFYERKRSNLEDHLHYIENVILRYSPSSQK